MSDQQASQEDKPELADNPEAGTGTTTEQQTQAEIDWQRQYQNLQPEYTRATQEASELRRERELYQQMLTADDPDARREAAEILGYEIPDDPTAEQQQFIDEQARKDAQKASQWIDSFEQQAQQYNADQAAISHINEQFPAIEKQLGRELTGEEAQVIGDLAMANRDEHGMPAVDPAAELVLGVLKAAQQSRPKPRAPHFSATGAEGTTVPDLSTHDGKVDHIMSRLHEQQQ